MDPLYMLNTNIISDIFKLFPNQNVFIFQNLSTTSMPISQSYSMTTTLTTTFAILPVAISAV